VLLRTARAKEAEALSRLAFRAKGHWGYDRGFLEASRPDLTVDADLAGSGAVFVTEADGGELLGFVSLSITTESDASLMHCFVDPEAIGTGVGRRLVLYAIDEARRLGADSLTVESDPNADGFYAALGFERIGDVASIVDPRRRLPVLRYTL